MSSTEAGFSTGMKTPSKTCSVWCGYVEECAPWSSPGHREHAAVLRGADEIAAVQRIACAIDAGTLAVPHAEHAIDTLAGKRVELLRAVKHGRGEVFVDARLEPDVLRGEHFLPAPELPVEPAQRRAAIAGDQPAGVQAGGAVETGLFQQDADQRLDAGQQDGGVELGRTGFPAWWPCGRDRCPSCRLSAWMRDAACLKLGCGGANLPCEARARTRSWQNSGEAAPKVVSAIVCCRAAGGRA